MGLEAINRQKDQELLEAAAVLGQANSESIKRVAEEGRGILQAAQDPSQAFLAPRNPFLQNDDREVPVQEAVRFAVNWKLAKEPRNPQNADELVAAALDPSMGAMAKVGDTLRNREYERSAEAFALLEEHLREIFITTDRNSSSVAAQEKARSSEVSWMRSVVGRLVAKVTGRKDEAPPRYSDAPTEYPTKIADVLCRTINGNPPTTQDTAALVELHVALKKISPLFAAFRLVLADEIREKEAQQKEKDGSENFLKPLVLKEGLLLALSQSTDTERLRTIFALLPTLLDKSIDNLEEARALPEGVMETAPIENFRENLAVTPHIGHEQAFYSFRQRKEAGDTVKLICDRYLHSDQGIGETNTFTTRPLRNCGAKLAIFDHEQTPCDIYHAEYQMAYREVNGEMYLIIKKMECGPPFVGYERRPTLNMEHFKFSGFWRPILIGKLNGNYERIQIQTFGPTEVRVKLGEKNYKPTGGNPSESIF